MSGGSVRLTVRPSPPLVLYELGSSLYTLATEPPQVAASAQVSASGPVAPPCSCCLLSQQTLLWHHRLGHPSLPRLRGMHSRLLVSGLPRSLPPLPPSLAPPCLPCVEGRQRAAPHSSSFPPTSAPLQTLHMNVWGPARVNGQGRERYFLLVVDDYTQYTTVFPLRSKGEVVDVLIPWIRAVRLQLRERFCQDLPVLRLHSDRGGEFSSDLLRDFCRREGILQLFTLPDSPQQNGIAERRIGLVMEVARTSMIHAAAPHFLWPFAVRYAAHQLNLWPRVSLPETSPTLRWTGKVGDASVFRIWGSRAFVRDTSADKLSARAISCVFLGFSPDAPGWQFYHPTSHRVFPSHDVTFDKSVPIYLLFPYRSAPPPPPPLFLAPGPPPVDPLPPQGPAPSGVSQVNPLPDTVPVEVAVGSCAAPGAASGGATSKGAEPGGAEPGVAEPGDTGSEGAGSGGAEPEGAESEGARSEGAEPRGAEHAGGAESGGAEPRGTASFGGPARAPPRLSPRLEPLSPQQLREWFAQRTRLRSEAAGAGVSAVGDPGAGGTGVTAGAGGTGGAAAAGTGGARTGGTGAEGTGGVGGAGAGDSTELGAAGAGGAGAVGAGARGSGAGGAGAIDPGAGGAGGTVRPRPYFVPLLQQIGGLTERCESESRPAFPVRTGRRVPRPRPPPVPGTHAMALRPSSVPLRVPLPPPPESSLPAILDPESDRACAASPTVSRLLAIVVTDPSFESTAASALVAELVDFASTCRPDYASTLVSESESVSPPSVGGECALGTDVLEDRQEDFECLAAAVLQRFSSQFSSPQPTPLSTGHSLSAPPSDESVEPSGPYPELVGCLIYLMTCTQPNLAYPISLLARYVVPGRHRKVHWDAAKRVLRYLCSTSGMGLVLGGRGPVVLTGHADASWAMIALCQEHRLEHRTKHIALRYFLARELQQRGQLRLAYVATRANTADIFTKALPPGDHQPCFAFLDWSCDPLVLPLFAYGERRSRVRIPVCALRASQCGGVSEGCELQCRAPRESIVPSAKSCCMGSAAAVG
ncbi:unnamed protein product [Closterium sp. NIES-53]